MTSNVKRIRSPSDGGSANSKRIPLSFMSSSLPQLFWPKNTRTTDLSGSLVELRRFAAWPSSLNIAVAVDMIQFPVLAVPATCTFPAPFWLSIRGAHEHSPPPGLSPWPLPFPAVLPRHLEVPVDSGWLHQR